MKISIELTDDGDLRVDVGEDEEPDIAGLNTLLDLAKMNLLGGIMRGFTEKDEPEVETDDEVSV